MQLLESDGSFLLKAFYDLATVKGVDCKVLIITDAFSGKKTGYILTKNDTSQSMKLLDLACWELAPGRLPSRRRTNCRMACGPEPERGEAEPFW